MDSHRAMQCSRDDLMPPKHAHSITHVLTHYTHSRTHTHPPAPGHLLSVQIWISDMANFEEMNGVYDPWLDADSKPTRACVQAQMGHGAAVEIRASAGYE